MVWTEPMGGGGHSHLKVGTEPAGEVSHLKVVTNQWGAVLPEEGGHRTTGGQSYLKGAQSHLGGGQSHLKVGTEPEEDSFT